MSEPTIQQAPPPPVQLVSPPQRHPVGLYTLFFTEMWERLSYYGMRALLVLFMVDSVRGGMGLDDATANSIYGLYTGGVYLAALPGGWLADRFLGAQRAVWYGGIIIALGHFVLAIPRTDTFFVGLVLVVIGTGMLKPNVSAMVGDLYPEGGARRDAGFSIFYMGINLGAFLAPLTIGTLGEKINWHYGFGAAGVGMVLGLTQYQMLRPHLGEIGLRPGHAGQARQAQKFVAIGGAFTLVLIVVLGLARVITFNPISMAEKTTTILVVIALVFFAGVIFFGRLDNAEKKRVWVILILCATGALFWAGFEQAGSSFNLFADRYTERKLAFAGLHFSMTTTSFQSIGPIFVIALSPVMGAVWLNLGRRNLNPSIPLKFGFGLVLLGLGFLVLAGAAIFVVRGQKVLPTWLIMTYLLHTFGELCVSPVGLSSVTKLAPKRLVGQMMGAWFLATSLGNLIAGRFAGELDPNAVGQMPGRFLQMVILPVGVAIVIIALSRPIKKMMGGVT